MLGPVVGLLLLLGGGLAVARSGEPVTVDPASGGVMVIATDSADRGLEGVIDNPTAEVLAPPAAPVEVPTGTPIEATPTPTPSATAAEVTEVAPVGGPLAQLGSCFNGQVDSVPAIVPVPCEASHGNEIYVLVDDQSPPGSPYPGRDALLERTAELCRGQAFTDYVGVPWAESRFFTSPVVPSEESWGKGDRSVACFLYDLNGERVGSARGVGAG